MPKVKRSKKPPPEGWELIEPTLEELDLKMREHETESHEGKRKVRPCHWQCQTTWTVLLIKSIADVYCWCCPVHVQIMQPTASFQLFLYTHQVEALWPIFKIHHQKSRYLYDLYYKRKAISKELYDYCLKVGVQYFLFKMWVSNLSTLSWWHNNNNLIISQA